MTISYPLSLPENVGITQVKFSQSNAVAISESPWTYYSQTQVHPGQRWIAEISLPVMTRDQAELWQCFLLSLNGIAGSFLLGDHLQPEPRGNWSGIPAVNGANQRGTSINLKGFVPGATVQPGDRFQIGYRLYKYIGMTTAVADGSGNLTLDIFPRLRESPADGSGVITEGPKGLFRLADNQAEIYNSVAMEYYQISISCVEAL